MMGNVAFFNKLASPFAPLSNLPLKSAIGKELLERYAGIDKRRELPMLASQTFKTVVQGIGRISGVGCDVMGRWYCSRTRSRTTIILNWGSLTVKVLRHLGIPRRAAGCGMLRPSNAVEGVHGQGEGECAD